jgi:hypothetical protein
MNTQSSIEFFHMYETRKPLTNIRAFHGIVRAVLSTSHNSNTEFPSVKQILMQMHCSFIRKLWITLSMHKNKHPLRINEKGCGCKTHSNDRR